MAVVHTLLVQTGVLVCPKGILQLGPAPLQSLIAYLAVTALLLPGALRRDASLPGPAARAVGLIGLGAVLALRGRPLYAVAVAGVAAHVSATALLSLA